MLRALDGMVVTIGMASDRTGTRLEGPCPSVPSVPTVPSVPAPSTPMVHGAVEQTPSGLVVLGPDHPTTGGYPVVAIVHSRSLDDLFGAAIGASITLSVLGP